VADVYAIDRLMNNQHASTTGKACMIHAAFAASHPTIPTTAQEMLIALS